MSEQEAPLEFGPDAEPDGEFAKLLDLAHARSSEKRRALLREITDLFMEHDALRQGDSLEHVDVILSRASEQVASETRVELAQRFADSDVTPARLARKLLSDVIEVARPLLLGRNGVPEEELRRVAEAGANPHLRCLAQRPELPASVCDAIIDRKDPTALGALAGNETARLTRNALERMVELAEHEPMLHEPLVHRKDTPADLLNELFFLVEGPLREEILRRNETLTPGEIAAAFEGARDRLKRVMADHDDELRDARRFMESRKLRRSLTPSLLLRLLEANEHLKFYVCFAELAGLSDAAARRLCENPRTAPFATACKAAGFPTEVFASLAILRPTSEARADSDPDALAATYEGLPREVAQRVIRFWNVRQSLEGSDESETETASPSRERAGPPPDGFDAASPDAPPMEDYDLPSLETLQREHPPTDLTPEFS